LVLWFWGPCEVASLELPWLLTPDPPGEPSSWGWRDPVARSLHYALANGPTALTWGIPAAAAVRAWRARAWVWTERAAFADAAAAAFLLLAAVGPQDPADLVQPALWVASVGLASWWITGRLGVGGAPAAPSPSPAG
jgi:hypothetical protein